MVSDYYQLTWLQWRLTLRRVRAARALPGSRRFRVIAQISILTSAPVPPRLDLRHLLQYLAAHQAEGAGIRHCRGSRQGGCTREDRNVGARPDRGKQNRGRRCAENVAGVQRACAACCLPLTGAPGFQANRNGADELPVLENKLIDRCKRAEDQLARALEREQLLKQKLDEHAYADQSLHKQLDINLAALDQKVADMRDTLSQRDLSIARSQLIVAQLEKQNGALKQQLEIANQKLDDHAELERQHRLKMKEALEKVKNADKVRSLCWGSVDALRRLAMQIMDCARCWSQG
jgi:hypothetical protein